MAIGLSEGYAGGSLKPKIRKRFIKVTAEKKLREDNHSEELHKNAVKFEVYGQEMLEKSVKLSGNSGSVYLPPNWVGHQVKIIRVD
jgi:putative transposon-encoded protein